MSNLALIDIIFLVLVVLFLIRGHIKGFIAELLSWASLVLGILAAVYLYKNGAVLIRTKMLQNVKYLPEIMAFLLIFLIVFLIIKILENILKEIINGVRLGGVDKFLGTLFGFIEGVALVSLILFILTIQPLFDASSLLQESIFAEVLLPFIIRPAASASEIVFVSDSLKLRMAWGV
jgi:membrane protein required for colicin V production